MSFQAYIHTTKIKTGKTPADFKSRWKRSNLSLTKN